MKNPTIGIKIADGSYFPIMEEGSSKRKRLVLTTVNDNQENVQIDLYKGDGEELLDAVYVGSLLIENIAQGPKELSEIELKLGFAQDGTLNAEAGDPGSGQYESMSISMETLGESSVYDTPDFSLDDEMEDLQIDEEISLDADMEDLQLDDLGEEDLEIDMIDEEISLDDDMEDLQLDDLGEEDLEIDIPGEELSLDDDVEDMQLDDFGDEDLEIDMVGDELSLDNDIDQNLDLDSEELSLDDEDFDFDDLEEDSLEVEDFDMEVDDEELFDESSENITEDEFEKTSDSVLEDEDEDEDDYTPGILSESETVHKKEKEGGNPLLIALLVIIAIAAIAGISYLLFRSLQGEDSPALEAKAGSEETVSEVEPEALLEPIVENAEESTNGEQPKDDTTAVPELAVQESTKVLDSTGVWYKIRWGDTLWGISYSFYDSPRDFNEIVKENKIKNPDIIFAETEIFIPSR